MFVVVVYIPEIAWQQKASAVQQAAVILTIRCVAVTVRERLESMMEAMRERLAGKMGNANNNAFKLRKLFKMWDSTGSGRVRESACPTAMAMCSDGVTACICALDGTSASFVCVSLWSNLRSGLASPVLVTMTIVFVCQCSATLRTSG